MIAFPFSFIDNFPNHEFLGDTQTGPIVCLSFFNRNVHGNFGTSGASATSLVSSWTMWGSMASAVSLVNHTPGLVAVIVFSRDFLGRTLKGDKSA